VARIRSLLLLIGFTLAAVVPTGCQSSYNSDRDSLFDGALGPGAGEGFGAATGEGTPDAKSMTNLNLRQF
jgi:hypothetical protein